MYDFSAPYLTTKLMTYQNIHIDFQVSGLQKDPFSVPRSVRGTQQGPIRWRKEMEKVKCNFKNLLK